MPTSFGYMKESQIYNRGRCAPRTALAEKCSYPKSIHKVQRKKHNGFSSTNVKDSHRNTHTQKYVKHLTHMRNLEKSILSIERVKVN